MKPWTIFISIAAYREFDLLNTLRDALAQAAHPDRLRFCICWQHAEGDTLAEFAQDSRVQVIDVPHQQSRGVCWARNLIQRCYRDETYALQIDGHHRFAADWDRRMVEMLEGLRSSAVPKPVLTGYLPSFDPFNDPAGRNPQVWLYGFDRIEPAGVVFMRPFMPEVIPQAPVPSRFWSAHFSFSDGHFNREVVIDPHGYFHAEEIGTGVRAWTHGYDFFTPHETLMWHEYSRQGRTCHWDDHSDWGTRHARAIARYRSLFGLDGTPRRDFGPYGFGQVRSFEAYQRFAGICFETRGIELDLLRHVPPPSACTDLPEAVWRQQLWQSYSIDIMLERAPLLDPDPSLYLALFANAADGRELFRMDYGRDEIDRILASQTGSHIQLLIQFVAQQPPATWTAWPGSGQRGWMEKTVGHWPELGGPTLLPGDDPRAAVDEMSPLMN